MERMESTYNPQDEDIDKAIEKGLEEHEDAGEMIDKIAPTEAGPESKVKDEASKFANEAVTLLQRLRKEKDGQVRSDLKKQLEGLKGAFSEAVQKAGGNPEDAGKQLREWLATHHEAYFNLGDQALASDIDSFSRSLETADEVTTDAGKAFVRSLEAGEFPDLESAMNQLDDIKNKSAGVDADRMNAEFNILYAKINEKFLQGPSASEELKGASDKEIDDIFGGLE